MKPTEAGVYVRVSTVDQNTESQESELVNFVQNRGWRVQIYRDHGQSGAKENRPALEQVALRCTKAPPRCGGGVVNGPTGQIAQAFAYDDRGVQGSRY